MNFGETADAKMLLPGDVVRNTLCKQLRLIKTIIQGMSFGFGQLIGIWVGRVPKIPKDAIAKESRKDSFPYTN